MYPKALAQSRQYNRLATPNWREQTPPERRGADKTRFKGVRNGKWTGAKETFL